MGLKQQIIDFLDSLGDITEDEPAPVIPEEPGEEPEPEEPGENIDPTETGAAAVDEVAEAEAEAEEPGEETETPGTADDGSAEDGDLRATITEQAALIETLRNTIAELGGDDPTETAADAEAEIEPDPSEGEVVEAFETDYAERQARLAEIND